MWSRKKHVVKLTNFVSTCGQKCAGSGRWSKKNVCSKNVCSNKISGQRKCYQKCAQKKPVVKENQWSNLRSLALPKMWSSREKKCGQNSALPKNVWSKKIINNSPHKKGITTLPFPTTNSLTYLTVYQLSAYHLLYCPSCALPKLTKNRCFSKNSDFSGRARKKIIFSLAPEFLTFF